jgi:hypothetical protein
MRAMRRFTLQSSLSGTGGTAFVVLALFSWTSFNAPLAAQNCASGGPGNPCVATAQYNNQRTAYNPSESALTATTITTSNPLKQKFILPVDTDDLPTIQLPSQTQPAPATYNPIYAQPLYVPQIAISNNNACNDGGNHTCNMVIGVTLNDTVFAWNPATQATIWSRTGNPTCFQSGTCVKGTGGYGLYATDCGATGSATVVDGSQDGIYFEGILSTPVIDTTLSPPTMFLTTFCKPSGQVASQYWLNAISLLDGSNVANVAIPAPLSQGVVPPFCPVTGSNGADGLGADGCASNLIEFKPSLQKQRSALLESNSKIYMAFGTRNHENSPTQYPYHGWIFAYNNTFSYEALHRCHVRLPLGLFNQCLQPSADPQLLYDLQQQQLQLRESVPLSLRQPFRRV